MFLLLVLAISWLVYYIIGFYREVAKYPKGPTPIPFLGNVHQLTRGKVYEDMERFAAEYGSVFTVFLPLPLVVITDYEAVREAFVQHGDEFSARPENPAMEALQYMPNGGVINSNGEIWREQRRTAISILRDFGMGKNLMEEKVKESIREYLRCLADIKDKDRVDLRWPIQLMIANIINETLFGFKYAYDDCERLIDYVEGFNKFLSDLSKTKLLFIMFKFPWIKHVPWLGYHAFTKHSNNMKYMNRYIEEQCDRTTATFKEDEESTCFVHSYLQRMPSNAMLTHEQLRGTCSDFFVAGQETTTTTLRWAMLFLADNQEAQSKVREEILAVVDRSRLPSMADKPKMPYTSATVLEIQRRANILASNVTRQSTADCTIKGVNIPAGSYINGDIHYILANDPIFKNPKEFRPERYLMEDGKTLNKEAVEHTIPFSLGKRQCAGEALARVELFLGLAATLQHYRILPPIDGTPINFEPEFFQVHLPKPQKLQLVPL